MSKENWLTSVLTYIKVLGGSQVELRGFAPTGVLDKWSTGVMGLPARHREASAEADGRSGEAGGEE